MLQDGKDCRVAQALPDDDVSKLWGDNRLTDDSKVVEMGAACDVSNLLPQSVRHWAPGRYSGRRSRPAKRLRLRYSQHSRVVGPPQLGRATADTAKTGHNEAVPGERIAAQRARCQRQRMK